VNRGLTNILYVALILLLLLFLDSRYLQPEGYVGKLEKLWNVHPGYRPGRRTADYLEKVMVTNHLCRRRLLAVIAILPTLISSCMGVKYGVASFYGVRAY